MGSAGPDARGSSANAKSDVCQLERRKHAAIDRPGTHKAFHTPIENIFSTQNLTGTGSRPGILFESRHRGDVMTDGPLAVPGMFVSGYNVMNFMIAMTSWDC